MSHESAIVFTIFYALLCFCIVYPSTEFVSAGLTVDHVFSSTLGSESMSFVQHHIRRTSLNLMVHSLLPVMYIRVYFMQFDQDDGDGGEEHRGEPDAYYALELMWKAFIVAAIVLPGLVATAIYYWSRKGWENHPIARRLGKFCDGERLRDWKAVAASINDEYRRDTKVVIKMNPVSRVVVTESWIIKTGPYWINIANQDDTALIAYKSDTHDVSQEAFETVQYVNIAVKPTRPGIREFSIRINALDFKDLQDRINRPITILSSVKFHRSVLDRFVDVFKEQVSQNPTYRPERTAAAVDNNQDSCFACMQAQPNIKILKNCLDVDEAGAALPESRCCQVCNCRPMWCIDCVAKWFASRQNQSERESWLQQKCTCPMCRARFCVLDVCYIEGMG